MNRKEIIELIMFLSGDEFENIENVLTLAKENKKQLKQRLEYIKQNLY